jgi:hypothetical protein
VHLEDGVEVARVEEPVRLVEHEEFHSIQGELAGLDEIPDPAIYML